MKRKYKIIKRLPKGEQFVAMQLWNDKIYVASYWHIFEIDTTGKVRLLKISI